MAYMAVTENCKLNPSDILRSPDNKTLYIILDYYIEMDSFAVSAYPDNGGNKVLGFINRKSLIKQKWERVSGNVYSQQTRSL